MCFQSLKASTHLLGQLSKILKLTRVQEVVFAIALLKSSNPDTRQHAGQFLRQKLPQLIASYIDIGKYLINSLVKADWCHFYGRQKRSYMLLIYRTETGIDQEGGLQDIAIEVLHLVLNELTSNQENLGISAEQIDQFLKAIQKGLL